MPVNPKHAEEYELPELPRDPSSRSFDLEAIERERLLSSHDVEDKLEGLSGADQDGQAEQLGKGTKIDQLIARVCIAPWTLTEH